MKTVKFVSCTQARMKLLIQAPENKKLKMNKRKQMYQSTLFIILFHCCPIKKKPFSWLLK